MTSARRIPFFNYPALFKEKEADFMKIFQDVCSRGAYILQRDLQQFEENLKEFLGVKHAFGVADGTNAMIIGLRAVGIQPGDEVIVSSHTYIATAAAVHFAGGTPVLVDIGYDNMIDPKAVEAAITPKTRFIMPTQLNGRCCDMDALQEVASRHGLIIVEDAAQGLGAKFKGRCAGTFGAFGTYSFYPAKLLGCFGDGGAIVTNDDEVARRITHLRDHGRNEDGAVVAWGTNSRLDNLQAAILDFKLTTYPDDIARRRDIARQYDRAFAGIPQIARPVGPDDEPDHFDVYQNYEMAAERRDDLKAYLADKGIGTIIQWAGVPVHQFRELGFDQSLPATERFFVRCLMLPLSTALSDDDVEYICASVASFYR